MKMTRESRRRHALNDYTDYTAPPVVPPSGTRASGDCQGGICFGPQSFKSLVAALCLKAKPTATVQIWETRRFCMASEGHAELSWTWC